LLVQGLVSSLVQEHSAHNRKAELISAVVASEVHCKNHEELSHNLVHRMPMRIEVVQQGETA
jgi:hypothetical protein